MKRNRIVQKYGGSSLAQPGQIRAASERIAALRDQGTDVLVVVSAMGKTTDQLVDLAYQVSPAPNRRELDMLLTTGERISMALMSMALNDRGCEAISFTGSQAGILTDESHSNARIIDVKPSRVESELARGRVVVLAGFQGVSPMTKEVTTLGRGGSDTTAVALAAYFKADHCEIRKDVDGVYSADPHQVSQARHLSSLHFQQLLEMTFWGAKVLHYRSVELATVLDIPLVVTLAHGDGQQTRIDGEPKMYEQARILSVNSHKDVRWIHVEEEELSAALEAVQSLLRDNKLPWPQMLDTQRTEAHTWSLLVTAPQETLNSISSLSQKNSKIQVDGRALCTVTATCQGSFASALAAEISLALRRHGVKLYKLMLSPMSLTVLLDPADAAVATRALHDLDVQPSR